MSRIDTLQDAAWQQDAACADEDPDLFFPGDEATVEEAKRVCARCPVRTECLETALAVNEMHGVWGGMAEGERRRLIRRRRRERRQRERRAEERASEVA